MSTDKMYATDKMSTEPICLNRQNAEQTKSRTDKMSIHDINVEHVHKWRIVTKCRTDKMSNRQNVEQIKMSNPKVSDGPILIIYMRFRFRFRCRFPILQ